MFKISGYSNFRSFVVSLAIGAALVTVNPLEQWSGSLSNAFRIGATAFAQENPSLTLNGVAAPVTVAPGATITIKVVNPTGNAKDWIGIYLVGQSAARPTKSVVEHYVAGTAYVIPTTTPVGNYEARLFANDSLTVLAKSAPITVSTGTTSPPSASYTLTITQSGTGQGNTTGAGTYASGTVVTMTGTAASGSTFGGWSGTGCSTGRVTISANTTCTATFTLVSPPTPSTNPSLTLNGGTVAITVAPAATITIKVVNPTGNAKDWIGIYPVGLAAGTVKSVVEHYVAGTAYVIPTTTPVGNYEARLFANDSLTLVAKSAPITVSTGTPLPPVAPTPAPVASPSPTPAPVASLPPPPPPTSSGCPAGATYVSTSGNDSNPGTQAAPWRTFGKVSTSGSGTVCFMDGTYTEGAITFRNRPAVMLVAENQGKAILASTSGCQASLNMYSSRVIIDGLHLSVSPSDQGGAYQSGTCPTTANYYIHAWEQNEASPGAPYSGYVGFEIRNSIIDFSAKRYGSLKTLQDDSLMENNVFGDQVEVSNAANVIIRYNTWPGLNRRDWSDTIIGKAGDRNLKVYGNTVHVYNDTNAGVELGGTTGNQWLFDPPSGVECYTCEAYGNTVTNNNGSNAPLLGFAGCKDCTIHDNTGTGGGFFRRNGGLPGSPGSSNPGSVFKNNTINGMLVP